MAEAARLNNVERLVLSELWRRSGSSMPDLSEVQVVDRNSNPAGFMTILSRSAQAPIPDRERHFPERVLNGMYVIANGIPFGILVFFDGPWIDAVEGYSIRDDLPDMSCSAKIASEEEVNLLLKGSTT
jgi:hypothetical protein